MPDNATALKEREQRIFDAIALKEPDRVPILAPTTNQFPYISAGHSMAEITYEVDMARAKKELGNIACIAGNFPYQKLARGTKDQVIDEAKRLLDIMAPGGGYIFDLDGGMYGMPEENLEALYQTIKEYGKY